MAAFAVLGLVMVGLAQRPKIDPALAKDVHVYTGVHGLSPDGKGTAISGFIENHAGAPVDVKVRVRCRDIYDHVFKEFEMPPFRKLVPGSSTTIQTVVDTVPIERVEIELIELAPSRR